VFVLLLDCVAIFWKAAQATKTSAPATANQINAAAEVGNAPPADKVLMLPPPKFLFAAAGFFRLHWQRFFTVLELDD
jgi:hypothetical protein